MALRLDSNESIGISSKLIEPAIVNIEMQIVGGKVQKQIMIQKPWTDLHLENYKALRQDDLPLKFIGIFLAYATGSSGLSKSTPYCRIYWQLPKSWYDSSSEEYMT